MTKNITNQKFGRWTVIKRAGTRTHTKSKPALWEVLCDCGNVSIVAGTDLRSGQTKSCGCLTTKNTNSSYRGSKHHSWKGGISKHPKGYIQLAKSEVESRFPTVKVERKMFEHTAIMSQHLGRPLYKEETVHHKNGDRSDNRIENLELRVGNHGPGQSIADLVAWANEILKRYT